MLREFVDTPLSVDQVGELLTMASFELEGIEDVEGEPILDVKVVSNRGDGLSVFGLAREVLAKDRDSKATELYKRAADRFRHSPTPSPRTGHLGEGEPPIASVVIETEACTRYACRLFKEIKNGPSPEWLQKRIRQAGWRPISLIVDLTNYVMLELGQPLHAFDLDKLHGAKIIVRDAQPGEKITTLDGTEHTLKPGQMMICDADRAVAVAGVMGGHETEVDAGTTAVLLESAHFVNTSVRRTRKQLGLSTEASYRFERSVDPEGVVAALNRFAELFESCLGGIVVPGVVDVYPAPPVQRQLAVRMSRAVRLLGMEVSASEARSYLDRLGFGVAGEGEPFQVTTPSWRADIVREDDVVEEIGRVHGYDRIPETALHGVTVQGGVSGVEARLDQIREGLLRAGFTQIISHSLRDLHPLDLSIGVRIGPRNAGSPETAYLRNSHLPCLADAAQRNGARDLHLFEMGSVFDGSREPHEEWPSLAIWTHGALAPSHRAKESWPKADFFSLKGAVQSVCEGVDFSAAKSLDPRLHPTRQAALTIGGEPLGVAGQIHPELAEQIGVPSDTCLAELDLERLLAQPATESQFKALSRNPAVRRDLAVLISKSVPYAQIERAVQAAAGVTLERQWLFDVYEGQGIPEGQHSLAIALQLRKFGENFTDEEANQVRDVVAAALEGLGGKLR